jgi:small subunit ribosomal protein S17
MTKKHKIGIVVSIKSLKTLTVSISKKFKHLKYGKNLIKTKSYLVHNENLFCNLGDLVLIEESRPISKNKTWILNKILLTSKN